MGRDKSTANRVKGNLRPSDSSRAAELLGSTGASNVPFIGFDQFAPSSNSGADSPDGDDRGNAMDPTAGLHADLAVILRKLSKRDATTKLKALEELQQYLFGSSATENATAPSDVTQMLALLPFWAKIYTRLALDVDRRVRQATTQIHAGLMAQLHKKAASSLKEFIAVWALSMYDTHRDVAACATAAFQKMFPGDKTQAVLGVFQSEIMAQLVDLLTVKTPQTLSDMRHTTVEDSEAKYARVIAASINLLGFMLVTLDDAEREKCGDLYSAVLAALWRRSTSEHSIVRRAMYSLTKTLCSARSEIVSAKVPQIAADMFGTVFLERDPTAHEDMWDCILTLCKYCPQIWECDAKATKAFLESMTAFLRASCFGSVQVSFPSILVLLSCIPDTVLRQYGEQKLYNDLFGGWWSSLQSDFVDYGRFPLFIKSFAECLCYCALRTKSLDSVRALLRPHLLRILETALFSFENAVLEEKYIASSAIDATCTTLTKLAQVDEKRGEVLQFLNVTIKQVFSRAVIDHVTGSGQPLPAAYYRRVFSGIALFYSCMGKCDKPELKGCVDANLEALLQDCSSIRDGTSPSDTLWMCTELVKICEALKRQSFTEDVMVSLINSIQLISVNESVPDIPALVFQFPCEATWKRLSFLISHANRAQASELIRHLVAAIKTHSNVVVPAGMVDGWIVSAAERLGGELMTTELESLATCLSHSASLRIADTSRDAVFRQLLRLFDNSQRFASPVNLAQSCALLENISKNVGGAATAFNESQTVELYSAVFNSGCQHKKDHPELLACWDRLASDGCTNSPARMKLVVTNILDTQRKELLDITSTVNEDELAGRLEHLARSCSVISFAHCLCTVFDEQVLAIITDFIPSLQPLRIVTHPLYISHFADNNVADVRTPPQVDKLGLTLPARIAFFATSILCLIGFQKFFSSPLPQYYKLLRGLIHIRSNMKSDLDMKTFNLFLDSSDYPTFMYRMTKLDQLEKGLAIVIVHQATSLRTGQELLRLANNILQSTNSLVNFEFVLKHALDGQSEPKACFELSSIEDKGCQLAAARASQPHLSTELRSRAATSFAKEWLEVLQQPDSAHGERSLHLLQQINIHLETPVEFSDDESCPKIESDTLNDVLANLADRWKSDLATSASKLFLYELARFMEMTVRTIALLDNDQRNFLVGFCASQFHSLDSIDTSIRLAFQIRSISLIGALLCCDDEFFITRKQAWSELKMEASSRVLEWFLHAPQHRKGGAPLRLFRSVVARVVDSIPDLVLRREWPYDQLVEVLRIPHEQEQKLAYNLLQSLTSDQMKGLCDAVAAMGSADDIEEDSNNQARLPAALLKCVNGPPPAYVAGFADADQLGIKVDDVSYQAEIFGHFLAWMLILQNIADASASFKVKKALIDHLRDDGLVPRLIEYLAEVLDIEDGMKHAFDLSKWRFDELIVPEVRLEAKVSLPLLAAHLLYTALKNVPSLCRSWFNECKNRQLTQSVESYIERFFTPLLLEHETMAIAVTDKKTMGDSLSVRVTRSTAGYDVTATYRVDDSVIEIVIKLPKTYPLRPVEVEGVQRVGVSEERWRRWMLTVNSLMSAQNGSVLDALLAWKQNVDKHFEGIEDCAICYSIIGVMDRSLPSKQCKTCKNKFHAACLFKWFRTSNNSSCPLCRNLF